MLQKMTPLHKTIFASVSEVSEQSAQCQTHSDMSSKASSSSLSSRKVPENDATHDENKSSLPELLREEGLLEDTTKKIPLGKNFRT
jgi:hypothetical protein